MIESAAHVSNRVIAVSPKGVDAAQTILFGTAVSQSMSLTQHDCVSAVARLARPKLLSWGLATHVQDESASGMQGCFQQTRRS